MENSHSSGDSSGEERFADGEDCVTGCLNTFPGQLRLLCQIYDRGDRRFARRLPHHVFRCHSKENTKENPRSSISRFPAENRRFPAIDRPEPLPEKESPLAGFLSVADDGDGRRGCVAKMRRRNEVMWSGMTAHFNLQ